MRLAVFLALCLALPAEAGRDKRGASATPVERLDGLLGVRVQPDTGQVHVELPAPGPDGVVGRWLWASALQVGLGSSEIGLDRGQLGETRLVRAERVGAAVWFVVENTRFRVESADADERRAGDESFAETVLHVAPIVDYIDGGAQGGGGLVVDVTDLLRTDLHGVRARLNEARQGRWRIDPDRSGPWVAGTRAFPDNLVLAARTTLERTATSGSAPAVQAVEAAPEAITLTTALLWVRLPDDGFRPRPFDPRTGFWPLSWRDYGVPIDEPVQRAVAPRHRVSKADPIVYYVERTAPEPVRSALVDGASWWAEAFDAAGLQGAFRVELMPEGAHPLDVRYNAIQWVHRATRGWSYGGSLVDPRTGEILKGHVTLGSQRVRHDRLLFEALLGADGAGEAGDPVQLALSRIRQLSAHEVGHTLGLAHNFAASTEDRASVMDYPAPLLRVTNGVIDTSEAYGVGVGAWDRAAIQWGYGPVPAGAAGSATLAEWAAAAHEHAYVTDADARPGGSAHPLGLLWDNGADPAAGLQEVLAVRRLALQQFGADRVAAGVPLSRLTEAFAPVYLLHRYQLTAAIRQVGGVHYTYAIRPDAGVARPVPAADQWRALDAALRVLTPESLDIPESALEVLLPRAPGHDPSDDALGPRDQRVFDPIGAASIAASMVVGELLEPGRCARLVDYHRRDEELPGLEEVLDALIAQAFGGAEPADGRARALHFTIQDEVVRGLLRLAADDRVVPEVRSRVELRLASLAERLESTRNTRPDTAARVALLAEEIRRHRERSAAPTPRVAEPPPPPRGPPIGMRDDCGWRP